MAFAANSLSPAKINHVSILELDSKHLEVIVDDTQLSLAIGKKGQNVRLAAKLLGWHVDIKSEEEKRQEIESQMAAMALRGASISELQGLGEKTLERLREKGVETVEQLAQMTPDDLTQIPGIGEKTVEKIRRVVTDYFERDRNAAAAQEVAAEADVAAAVAEGEETVQVDETPGEQPATVDAAHEEESEKEPAVADTTADEAAAEESEKESAVADTTLEAASEVDEPPVEKHEPSENESTTEKEGGKEA